MDINWLDLITNGMLTTFTKNYQLTCGASKVETSMETSIMNDITIYNNVIGISWGDNGYYGIS